MASLTQDEARRRGDVVSVDRYQVALDLTEGGEQFGSVATIWFRARAGTDTFLDVQPRSIRRAVLNGTELDLARHFDPTDGRLTLPELDPTNQLVVDAVMAYSHDGEGLHRHVDPADGAAYLYAMSFLDAAPRWFACFDQPDLKAPLTLMVACPPSWTVLGNAPAEHLAPGHWRLATEHPIATYFATLVAGPYHSVTAEHDGIRLGVHARASLAAHLEADAPELLDITGRYLDEFHRLFGVRYPWGEYHQAFVPEFNAGAMENPGCVTIRDGAVFRSRVTERDRSLRASLVAHEMAHMWFGDLVTMRWWDDLWLNESFAEYLGHRVCDAVTDHESWVEFGALRKAWGYAADRRPSTHPVAGNGAADAKSALGDFDGISYAKGAAVLRQLGARLGDDVMLHGLRDYFHTHAYGNASFADLIGAWRDAGAHDLDAWADAWLRTSGLDTLRGSASGGLATVERVGHATTPRSHAVSIAAFDEVGRELGRAPVVITDRASIPVPETPALVIPDAADETWAKITFGADVWARMPALLRTLTDPLSRVSVWNALRLAVADAEIAPASALDVVTSAAVGEPSEVTLGVILAWAVDVLAGTYVPDGARPSAVARLAAVADEALRSAPPASGRQLTAARAFVTATHDTELLRQWLRDEALPAGLLLDNELRWAVLQRLASLGALTPTQIDAELERDHSTQGAMHAAKCRALRPEPAAKAAVWHILMTDAERSNHELYAMAEGFWHPEQAALTAPFAEAYFDTIASTAKLRSGWLVGKLALLCYPRTAVSAATLERSEALLADESLDSGIRRSVVDAADDLRRALAARERFA